MTLTPNRKEQLLERARTHIKSVRSDVNESRNQLERLESQLRHIQRRQEDVTEAIRKLEQLQKETPLDPQLAKRPLEEMEAAYRELEDTFKDTKKKLASSKQQEEALKVELQSLSEQAFETKWKAEALKRAVPSAEATHSLQSATTAAVEAMESKTNAVKRECADIEKKLKLSEQLRQGKASQQAVLQQELDQLRWRDEELSRLLAATTASLTDSLIALRETHSALRSNVADRDKAEANVKAQKSAIASLSMEINAMETKQGFLTVELEKLKHRRTKMASSQQDDLDRQLARTYRREIESLSKILADTPTMEQLEERKAKLSSQAEALCMELANVNEEVYLLQEEQVVGRCSELRDLIETESKITVPALEAELQNPARRSSC